MNDRPPLPDVWSDLADALARSAAAAPGITKQINAAFRQYGEALLRERLKEPSVAGLADLVERM